MRKVDPRAVPNQKAQSKLGKTTENKSTSMSSKLQNTLPDYTNTSLTVDTSVSLPTLDHNIMENMKKTCVNISLFELAKFKG